MNKRIAFFFWNFCIGGNENAALRLMRGLSKDDWNIWILSYHQADHIKGAVEESIANYVQINTFTEGDVGANDVVTFLQQNNISIIHIIWGDYKIAQLIKEQELKIHVVASTTNHFPEHEARLRLGTWVQSMQVPHHNDIAIVEQKDSTLSGRVIAIANGVDTNLFDSKCISEFQIAALKKELQLNDCQVIGTVGNIRPVKNHKLLISVLHELKKTNSQIKLVIVGDILVHDEYLSLQAYIKELSLSESVVFTGFQFDVRPYIALFDIYILSSLGTESCPNAVLEAMSLKKPIVAAENVGLDGLIEEAVNGYIVPQNDVSTMSQHVKKMLISATMMRDFGISSRKKVISNYTLDKMIDHYKVWYEAVLNDELLTNKQQSICAKLKNWLLGN